MLLWETGWGRWLTHDMGQGTTRSVNRGRHDRNTACALPTTIHDARPLRSLLWWLTSNQSILRSWTFYGLHNCDCRLVTRHNHTRSETCGPEYPSQTRIRLPGVTAGTNIKIKEINLLEYITQFVLDLIIVRKAVVNAATMAVLVAVARAEHKLVHNDVVVHNIDCRGN